MIPTIDKKNSILPLKIILALITFSAMAVGLYYYAKGFAHSPMLNTNAEAENRYLQKFIETNDQNLREEKLLAESYWQRYKDVRRDRYWGRNGPMGIWGARDHYQQHGRREGRIFRPLPEPEDLNLEKELAEVYWKRYPEIENNSIWGRNGALGILGPRDYHTYRGRFQGKIWGKEAVAD